MPAAAYINSYVGSMPGSMPARRELHRALPTFCIVRWGRWNPLMIPMPELLKSEDLHPHHISDHLHY